MVNTGEKNSVKQEPVKARPLEQTASQETVETPIKARKAESLNPRMLKSAPASHDMRYKLVKALHDQLVRLNSELKTDASASEELLVLSDQALITMVLDFEERTAIEKGLIYSNVVKNKILEYKRMLVKDWKGLRAKQHAQEEALKVSKDIVSPYGSPKKIETGLTEEDEIAFLPRLYTPVTGLAKHGYVSTVPSEEEISQAQKGLEAAKGWEVCDRCKSRFQVFPGRREEDGFLASGGSCTYHWGKAFVPERLASDPKTKREKRFKCCGQALGDSAGCVKGDSHVFKVSEVKRLAALLNFEETPENSTAFKTPICMDCEMCYTVHGLELIRLTATTWPHGEELLDVLVRPYGEILDLNSRFSGVWPQQMADAVPWDSKSTTATSVKNENTARQLRIVNSPAEARSLLFQYLSPQIPLIGHGLENDLNATRIIHPTIIDTALLYPHSAGLPYRNGLKNLMYKHLNRHIQVVTDGQIDGHDSKEDARAAGDLVRWKIGQEWAKMQRNGWKLQDGQFIAPPTPTPPAGCPTGPRQKSTLTAEFLESPGEGLRYSKNGGEGGVSANGKNQKRPIQEISGNDELEDGELEG